MGINNSKNCGCRGVVYWFDSGLGSFMDRVPGMASTSSNSAAPPAKGTVSWCKHGHRDIGGHGCPWQPNPQPISFGPCIHCAVCRGTGWPQTASILSLATNGDSIQIPVLPRPPASNQPPSKLEFKSWRSVNKSRPLQCNRRPAIFAISGGRSLTRL